MGGRSSGEQSIKLGGYLNHFAKECGNIEVLFILAYQCFLLYFGKLLNRMLAF